MPFLSANANAFHFSRIWDTGTGQCLRTLVHEDNPPVTSVCFAPNGRYVLAHSMDSCIRLWDYVAGSVKKTYQGHTNTGFSIGGCFGTIDGEAFIASSSEDGGIVLWDVKNKEVVQRIEAVHDGICFWVDVNGDTMVSAGQDGKIRVYQHRRKPVLDSRGPPDAISNGDTPVDAAPNTTTDLETEGVDSAVVEDGIIGDRETAPADADLHGDDAERTAQELNGDVEMVDSLLKDEHIKREQT